MSDEAKEESAPRRAESARQLLSAAGLLVAALTILGLGAVLAVDPKTAPPRPQPPPHTIVVDETPAPVETEPPPVERAAPAPLVTPPPPRHEEPPKGLAARAASDARKLAKSGNAFTVQLLLACKEDTVERYLRRDAGAPLFLLPASVNGQSCFRVSYGSYATLQEAAAAAKSVPSSLTSGAGAPSPKKIADLLL